jgi:glycosyltransferase involved in cell wall biosynthesis
MKVLQIYKTYTPDTFGGVEQVIKNIVTETQALGSQHSLLTVSKQPRQDQIDDLPVIRCKENFTLASCPFSLDFLKQFKKIARQFDILHFHYPWPFGDLSYLLRHIDQPSVVTYHADALKHAILKKIYAPIQHRFLDKVDCIVSTSKNLTRSSPILQKYQSKVESIPIGINPADYPYPTPALQQKWADQLGSDFALFVGVLRHYKGLLTLLEAAKKTALPIVIAGGGPLQDQLEALIVQHQLWHVHVLGRVSEADKIALLSLCNMVILPSENRAEAFGVSLLEGMIFRKPLISTELGTGTSFVNVHGVTGFVIPPHQAEPLAEKINFLHEHSHEAREMGEAAYTRFINEFQSATMGARYFKLYADLLR